MAAHSSGHDENVDEPTIKEMLLLQTSEIEMLQSMFPNSGELELDDQSALAIIQSYLEGNLQYDLCLRFGFTLKLGFAEKGSVDLVCHLPHEYPQVLPEIFIRSQNLTRSHHRQLTDALQSYIEDELERGELCLGFIIQWLQDNSENYLQTTESLEEKSKSASKVVDKSPDTFSRMWIYSHHIYSKIKRKDILEFADELQLSGFSMPGKPGIICIEGDNKNVEDFWHRIRRMQWKRLVMKEKEDTSLKEGKTLDECRIFTGFEEKFFEPRQGKGRGAYADRGLLFQFMEQNGCGHIFPIYFGVEGKGGVVDEDSD